MLDDSLTEGSIWVAKFWTAPIRISARELIEFMTYLDQWNALAGRIHGLIEAAKLHISKSQDAYGRAKYLCDQVRSVIGDIGGYKKNFEPYLSGPVLAAIGNITSKIGGLVTIDQNEMYETVQEKVWAALVMLGAFESEVTFLLSDNQETIHTLHIGTSLFSPATLYCC